MTKRFVLCVVALSTTLASPCFYLAYKADLRADKVAHQHAIYVAEQNAYNAF